MGVYCCVKGCGNNSNHRKIDPNTHLSFHSIPSNIELRAKWLKAIGRPNWVPTVHSRICSIHFSDEDINYEGSMRRIKDDATPTIHLPVNSNFDASNVEVCRICLATDIKMYSLRDSHLSSCLDAVAGFNENFNVEGLPQYVCYQCAACLIKCNKLVEKSIIAQATLLDIFATNGQITKPLIQQLNRKKLNLTSSLSSCITKDYLCYKYDEQDNLFNNTKYPKCTDNVNNIYLKSKDTGLILEVKSENETNKNARRLNVSKINVKNNFIKDHDYCHENSPGADSFSDEDVDNTVKKKFKFTIFKRLTPEEFQVSKKPTKRKADELTPDETNMQKNFDEVKLSRLSPEEFQVSKKPTKRKADELTPDETNMQNNFDEVQLSTQEQQEDCKKTVRQCLSVDPITVYECKECSKMFAHQTTYRLHLAFHESGNDINGVFRCDPCDTNFATEGARRLHLLTSSEHKKDNVRKVRKSGPVAEDHLAKCGKCGKQCSSVTTLETHMRHVHLKHMKGYPKPCQICGETMAAPRMHWQHYRRQHPDQKHTYRAKVAAVCDTCGRGFRNSTHLRLHQLRHRPPTVRCDKCPRLFYDKYGLALHATTHDSHKPYQCATCGMAFKLRSNFERHSKVHSDITPYECRLCGKKFKYTYSVTLHVRTVHLKQPYPPRKKRNKSRRNPKTCADNMESP